MLGIGMHAFNLQTSPKIFNDSPEESKVKFEHRWKKANDYIDDLVFMQECHEMVAKGLSISTVIFTRHTQCKTCGLLDYDLDATWIKTSRGGGQTYHDPGQIICYPIINLKSHEIEQCNYNQILCKWLYNSIACLLDKGASLLKIIDCGLWFKGRKVAFIGTRVSRSVTLHGFSINLDTDLKGFSEISPCGHKDLLVGNLNLKIDSTVNSLIKFCPFK